MSDPLFERGVPQPQGFREIAAREVHAHPGPVRLVDVRQPDEFTGELGHAPGAQLVPLAGLADAAQGWDRDQPVVLICRSGARSARGAAQLASMGFTQVMNLTGGTLAWREAGLPTER